MLELLAMSAGVFAAQLSGPITWVGIVIAVIIGFQKAAWWWPLVIVAGMRAITFASMKSWWDQAGINWEFFFLISTVAILILIFAAYGIGRGLARLSEGGYKAAG